LASIIWHQLLTSIIGVNNCHQLFKKHLYIYIYINIIVQKIMQTIYDLLQNKTKDEVLNIYYNMLDNNPELKQKYDLVIYDLYQINIINVEERIKRRNQETFRNRLIERYETCIITGSDQIVCEACHIIPFAECSEDDKYNVNNGLLLRSDLHKLFDKKLMRIFVNDNNVHLEISDEILDNPNMFEYRQYDKKKLNIDNKSIKYLKNNRKCVL
jgi:hypothetical protein